MKENDAQTTAKSHTKQTVIIIAVVVIVVIVIDAIIWLRIMFDRLSLSHSHACHVIVEQRAHMSRFVAFFSFIIWLHNLLSKRCRVEKGISYTRALVAHTIKTRAVEETARNKHKKTHHITCSYLSQS